jgi:hypothetical protein
MQTKMLHCGRAVSTGGFVHTAPVHPAIYCLRDLWLFRTGTRDAWAAKVRLRALQVILCAACG